MYKIIYFLFIGIIVALILLLNRHKIELGTYTAAPNPQTNITNIKSYIAIVRHGERYPTKNVFKKIDKSLLITKCDDLTPNGYQEMLAYGKNLKMNYPHIFNYPENYFIYSTTVKRAQESAQAVLDGLTSSNTVISGPYVDSFLKIHKFFLKQNVPSDVYSCQFACILNKKYNHCDNYKINRTEVSHDQINYKSIQLSYEKGKKCYDVISRLILNCVQNPRPTGYLFLCHDSTLAPLFYYFDILPDEKNYKNSEMLPFGSRIEIFIDYSNNVLIYLNGKFMKKVN